MCIYSLQSSWVGLLCSQIFENSLTFFYAFLHLCLVSSCWKVTFRRRFSPLSGSFSISLSLCCAPSGSCKPWPVSLSLLMDKDPHSMLLPWLQFTAGMLGRRHFELRPESLIPAFIRPEILIVLVWKSFRGFYGSLTEERSLSPDWRIPFIARSIKNNFNLWMTKDNTAGACLLAIISSVSCHFLALSPRQSKRCLLVGCRSCALWMRTGLWARLGRLLSITTA